MYRTSGVEPHPPAASPSPHTVIPATTCHAHGPHALQINPSSANYSPPPRHVVNTSHAIARTLTHQHLRRPRHHSPATPHITFYPRYSMLSEGLQRKCPRSFVRSFVRSFLPSYSGTWALRKQKAHLVPRFLSVFLAFGGLTPWFLNLSSVLYPPPQPLPHTALPRPHTSPLFV